MRTLVALLLLSGCASPARPLSAHTVQTAPDREVDVVWLERGGELLRCSTERERPVCRRVTAGE